MSKPSTPQTHAPSQTSHVPRQRERPGQRTRILGLVTLCLLLGPMSAWARPSLKRLNATWEELMGNQMIQAYYSVGLLGDLYRGKVYNKAKTLRILGMLRNLLKREKTFVKTIRVGRGRNQRALYRHINGTLDMLRLALKSLHDVVSGEEGADLKQFLQYRNAAAQDLQKLMSHQGLRRRRRYRGGRRGALRHLNHHLGLDLVYSYLTLGLIADGYFQLVLPPAQTKEYLSTNLKLMQSAGQALTYLKARVHRRDRPTLQRLHQGIQAILQQGSMLGHFVRTRNRAYLKKYKRFRRLAWRYVKANAAP